MNIVSSLFYSFGFYVDINDKQDFYVLCRGCPGQPLNVQANYASSQCMDGNSVSTTITWNAPTTGGSVDSYTVQCFSGVGIEVEFTAVAAAQNSIQIKGLKMEISYFCQVIAVNTAGSSTPGKSNNFVTEDITLQYVIPMLCLIMSS